MARYQRELTDEPVITQFTSGGYQAFLEDHQTICSMSAVSHYADNAAAEGIFGMLKRESVHRQRYQTVAEARTDPSDFIKRFHNPRFDRRIEAEDRRYQLVSS